MVWNETFEPRILHIVAQTLSLAEPHAQIRRGKMSPFHVRFKSREKPPIALQICHESRTLALKHYTPLFHSTTHPSSRAAEMNQTAVYFNPERDTVHILSDFSHGIHSLSQRTTQETIESIKVLAVEFSHSFLLAQSTHYLANRLPAFKRLETLVLVIGGDAEAHRKYMVEANDRIRLGKDAKWKEWKVPAVKAMNSEAFEGHL
jgi:hypothetical protein